MTYACTEMGSSAPTAATTGCPQGDTYDQSFTVMGGTAGTTYDVTIRVRGLVEPKQYGAQCTRRAATAPAQGAAPVDMLCVGDAAAQTTNYSVIELQILNVPAIAGQPQFVRFNSALTEIHYVYEIDETYTFKARPGTTLVLHQFDQNCRSIMNCGVNASNYNATATLCRSNARTVSDITLPATFRGGAYPAQSGGPAQPFQAQFARIQVVSIVPSQ